MLQGHLPDISANGQPLSQYVASTGAFRLEYFDSDAIVTFCSLHGISAFEAHAVIIRARLLLAIVGAKPVVCHGRGLMQCCTTLMMLNTLTLLNSR